MAENFIVSARKYRPDNWDTVIGQKHITTTLQSAIANQQIAQAYLFTGPRGVGKTTCARIFAKAVNGQLGQEMDELQFNIFELDAASNNSVDDIRNIVDTVRIPPQIGKYKVYIIDEVHMLSASAFNAFLKTLEEPPAHAIFILATTEKHKILPTILSRCQIFDFNRIKVKDISEHLHAIAAKEGVVGTPDVFHVIAEKADGAMRDALSIFDQVVAFCGRELNYNAVIENLNVLDYDYYFKLTDLLTAEDIPGSLHLFNQVLNKGFDGHHFITGLASHMRNLLVSRDPETIQLLEVAESAAIKYKEQAAKTDLRMLIKALDIINDCDVQYRTSKHQRLLVELTLMKIASIPYNEREGEKKKFRLKPFRSKATLGPSSSPTKPITVPPAVNTAGATPLTNRPNPIAPTAAPPTAAAPSKDTVTMTTGLFGNQELLRKSGLFRSVKTETAAAQPAAEKKPEEEIIEVASRTYSLDEIKNAWRQFTAQHLGHNMQILTAFKVAELELPANDLLIVGLPSETQKMYFDGERGKLGEFLRKNFDIKGIKFETRILKANEVKSTFKTEKQQFEDLVAQNPAIDIMRQKLGLQIDF
jgi:DNA polymerase III subunit gamma/tau